MYDTIGEHTQQGRWVRQAGLSIVGGMFLLGTWMVLYVWIVLATDALLGPWRGSNCCSLETQPALGTLARTASDFFDTAPGLYIPACIIIGLSAGIFAVRVVRSRDKVGVLLAFAWINCLVIVGDLLSMPLAHALTDWWWSRPTFGQGFDAGYHRTWLPLLVTVLWLAVLFMWQIRGRLPKIRQPLVWN